MWWGKAAQLGQDKGTDCPPPHDEKRWLCLETDGLRASEWHMLSKIKDQVNSGFINGRRIYSRAGVNKLSVKGKWKIS